MQGLKLNHVSKRSPWWWYKYAVFYTTVAISDYPRTCYEVQQEGNHNLDPEQDGLNPVSVFCNLSSTPVTAVLHHNQENSTLVQGYEDRGSYNAEVGSKHLPKQCTLAISINDQNMDHNSILEGSYGAPLVISYSAPERRIYASVNWAALVQKMARRQAII